MDQTGSKKWSDSGCTVMLVLTPFANGLDASWKRRGGVKNDLKAFGQRTRKGERKKDSQKHNEIHISLITRLFTERTWEQGEYLL